MYLVMKTRWRALSLIIALLAALSTFPSFAQGVDGDSDTQKYFPETGHYVSGSFWEFYKSTPNAEKLYGFPITEAFVEQDHERFVQYFERVRFYLDPLAPPELRVKVSPLGYFLSNRGQDFPLPKGLPACNSFDSEYQVCYAFLDFYLANGGPARLGYPVSNFKLQDGRIVQYFQRARLEWHPEFPLDEQVTLANLGRIYFDIIGEDPARLLPVEPPRGNQLPQPIIALGIRVYTDEAVLPQSGQVTIYAIVQDHNLLPVAGADVRLNIQRPDGKTERIIIPGATDKNGVIQYTYKYQNQPVGVVEITAIATKEHLQTNTRTSFRIWW